MFWGVSDYHMTMTSSLLFLLVLMVSGLQEVIAARARGVALGESLKFLQLDFEIFTLNKILIDLR